MTEPHVQDLKAPITVGRLVTHRTPAWIGETAFGRCGDVVAIRPCAKRFGDRTYLGVLLGDIAQFVSIRGKGDALHYDMAGHNPAILIPELDEVVFGNASWWGHVQDAEQLREITDEDISGVWYVKALGQIAKRAAEDAADDTANTATDTAAG